MVQAVSWRRLTAGARFQSQTAHLRFMVYKVAL
jgi:hypothetical protein